jgi:hypothetical protein
MKSVYQTCGLVAGLILVVTSPGSANDLNRQIKLLSVVYLGQQTTNMCAIDRPSFLEETSGPLGPMSVYAQHIKEEVMAGLRPEEITPVLVQAADFARSQARAKLSEFSIVPGMIDKQRLRNWCETVAKPYALKIMTMHDHQHDLFRCDITDGQERSLNWNACPLDTKGNQR